MLKNYIFVAPSCNVFMLSERDWENYFRENWDYEAAAYISEELQQTIKSHPGFSTPPIGPIGDYIVSDQLLGLIPQSCHLISSPQ